MKTKNQLPIRHENSILEASSERFFRNHLPIEWLVDKPTNDYGVDLIVTPVINGNVVGLNFIIQLKAQKDIRGKFEIRLKKSTLNYLFNRLEPVMIILYDNKTKQAYWKWLLPSDFDLSSNTSTHSVKFNKEQNIGFIDWKSVCAFLQKVFKTKNQLLTSLEYDLFNTNSELEVKAWSHYFAKNFNEASFYFKRLLKQETKSIWLLALSQSLYLTFDYRNAMLYINKASEMDSSDDILLTKGCILAEDGIRNGNMRKLAEAEKIFSGLFQKSPTAVHAYNYANTISKLNKVNEAKELYKYALKLNPNYAEAWKNLGQVYYDLKKHTLEMDCYHKALRINPNLQQAKVSKAITSGFIYKHYESAIKAILECISEDDLVFIEFPIIYYWLGFFYCKIKNIKEALKWINSGLNNNPADAWLLNLKANILFDSLDDGNEFLDEAISFFSHNYQLNKNDAVNFYFLCSSIERKNGRVSSYKLAISWLKEGKFINVFAGLNYSKTSLDFSEVLSIIKHWEIIESYSVHYSIEKLKPVIDYEEIINYNPVLDQLEVKRILFIAQFMELLSVFSNQKQLKIRISQLYNDTFLQIDATSICSLITAPKTDTERFSKEFSQVIVTFSELFYAEHLRCIGFIVGKRGIEKEKQIIDKSLDHNLYLKTFLHYTEKFYEYFDLPMK